MTGKKLKRSFADRKLYTFIEFIMDDWNKEEDE